MDRGGAEIESRWRGDTKKRVAVNFKVADCSLPYVEKKSIATFIGQEGRKTKQGRCGRHSMGEKGLEKTSLNVSNREMANIKGHHRRETGVYPHRGKREKKKNKKEEERK